MNRLTIKLLKFQHSPHSPAVHYSSPLQSRPEQTTPPSGANGVRDRVVHAVLEIIQIKCPAARQRNMSFSVTDYRFSIRNITELRFSKRNVASGVLTAVLPFTLGVRVSTDVPYPSRANQCRSGSGRPRTEGAESQQ
ncbi:hypothetical protein NFI96_023198 [Prochilodus magdalenae]|nr:hypothetical protein NFI96_023198 [Prochilodus magdalenae]